MAPMSPALLNKEDIVRDSIIENKERTKNYWTERMKAAENASNAPVRPVSNSNRNSLNLESTLSDVGSVEDEEPNVKEEKRRIELRQLEQLTKNNSVSHEQTMQEKIAREFQEMKEREEELANMRRSMANTFTTSEFIENLEDRASLDESNSEYGSEEKEPSVHSSTKFEDGNMQYRTQSMESISSGMSSGSLVSSGSNGNGNMSCAPKRRQVTVRPYDDPEFEPPTSTPAALFDRIEKETPIEREIRLAREREAEWGQLHGSSVSQSQPSGSTTLIRQRKDALDNDTRDVQHRIATNRIQQEIEETCEREMELRTEGKILTTSLETVDHKVTRFTQLAQMSMQSQNRTIRRATSQNAQLYQETVDAAPLRRATSTNTLSSNTQRIWKNWFVNKGKIVVAQPQPEPQLQVDPQPVVDDDEPVRFVTPPSRNGFISAEEKIRMELRDTQKRDEEWRQLQRSRALARSQPNLLAIDNEDDNADNKVVNEAESEITQPTSLPTHYASNPNLTDSQQYQTRPLPFNTKGCRKRFTLLEEWENRIQREQ